jgi:hypothetical protein
MDRIGFGAAYEPGLRLLYNADVFERFVDWLRRRYRTVGRLNENLDFLIAYAQAGGHLVVGPRTGYGDCLHQHRPERRYPAARPA